MTNKTSDTTIWIKSNENRFLIQDLKKQEVEEIDNDNIAKGVINTNIFIIIYLNE